MKRRGFLGGVLAAIVAPLSPTVPAAPATPAIIGGGKARFDPEGYDVMSLPGGGVCGNNSLAGNEEALCFYSDDIEIHQARSGLTDFGRAAEDRKKAWAKAIVNACKDDPFFAKDLIK